MNLVSTSNLVSLENEKPTTTCNFQTIAMSTIVMLHDSMTGQIGSYVNEKLLILSFMMAELLKSPLRNTYTQNSKIYQQ